MARFTVNDLKEVLNRVNAELEASGSGIRYKYGNRNGYHAVDRYADNGTCLDVCDCNERPKVLAQSLLDDYEQYL